ncbi:vanillin synthase /trans-feruloyl-CoA hydratase [Rhodoglobus vestalii]|uniref:Vanillin synthase /trans-feruloyl-CoA hydratase n=1 Tax=Rhodoglobus vestalii TaxID=193384 RepID=A0A8H2K9C3_9MICO|nr:crotonase/enoyl-CoA hydratase family protein [Rhodoglobus vestalii]TQO20051.1 vanillin synthase /trans-feruloyl-CoA hydratase [Rhodoglobus vestalii]
MIETVHSETRGTTLLITITREEKRNALDIGTISEIARLINGVGSEVRAVVLTAAGDHFSAGLDLYELVDGTAWDTVQSSRNWHEYMNQIQFGPVPVISALHGAVIGGGLELAASTHIRVADSTAYYALPEAARGLYVGGGGSARLPKLISLARMTDMMLTGRVLTAEEGHAAGLSQYLVATGKALETALELAEAVARNTKLTNFAVNHVLPRINDSSQEVGLLTESLMAALAKTDPQAQERLAEFLDGRSARVRPTNA